jgi:glycosyltransferase involved in cell wall biosynthesis
MPGVLGHVLEYGIAFPTTFLITCWLYIRYGFDAIHSANPPDFFFAIAAVFKPFGVKFIFDHHDLVPESCEGRWTGVKLAIIRRICQWAEKATFRIADRVIATNESYRQVALSRGRVRPDCAFVVRSAPSRKNFKPGLVATTDVRRNRPFCVGYLGVMGPNDGVDYLLKAIRYIVHDLGRHDIQFVLIGGGDLQPQLCAMSRELHIEEFASFTGRIPDSEVVALLSAADVCVGPDPKDPVNDLSSMNKIVEYMALGRPIVAFDLKETKITGQDAAVYAKPNDPIELAIAIIGLLDNPERRVHMGSRGRELFEQKLCWEHQRETLLKVYSSLWGEAYASNTQSPIHTRT